MTHGSRGLLLVGLALLSSGALLATPDTAAAQACPAGRSCFYVPPALPTPPGFTVDWDMVLASPRGTITGTWRAGAGAATPFSVSPGAPIVVPLSTTEGTASGYGIAETRGIFIEASSQELLVDHRLIVGPWQSSSTIKSSAFGLGTRFRLGGYNLNGANSADTGFDYVSVYAPFGGTVTLTAPTGATLPFWEGTAGASISVTLTPGQTYLARTIPAAVCTREIDAALVTSTEPIAVDTGGRGWSGVCGVGGGCGDDGADNVLPTTGLGTQFVLVDFPTPSTEAEDVLVVADTDGTEVRVNGTLVATLAGGGTHVFTISGTTYVETTQPVYVYQTTGLSSCEVDLALIPALALAPLGGWVVDFDVPAGFVAEIGIVIATANLASVRLDGAVPTFLASGPVPGHPELSAARVAVTAGSHSVSAGADFQLGLVTAGGGTGLFGYYTPFRIPGCGDGTRAAAEACDDGNLTDGDGCSSSCKIEIGFTGCTASPDCVPAGRCDAGTCVARCFSSAECNDSNPCTTDACDGTGACTNAPVAAGGAGACTAGLVCSGAPLNVCVACVDDTTCAAPTPHCDLAANACVACTADAHCDDGSECTTDACAAGGSCAFTPRADGTACASGRCASGACTTACGDGIVSASIEACDDGNVTALDGCSATCTIEPGWACGCASPIITYSMDALAGRVGGDGGGVGPDQGCTGDEVLIGLAIDWSDGRGEGVRTTTICGAVSVSPGGVVTTTPTTRDTQGGSGCGGWDPSTPSADVVCPTGWAIVGITGAQSDLGGTPTLFNDLSIVCQELGADGSAFGPTMTLNIAGGGGGGVPQVVSCPMGAIARFFRTRSGCGQDALDLFCGVASAACGGAGSICTTLCGDGAVGAPVEACDDGGESAACDADCTAATCGDGTTNATAGEDCDGSGETAACDADCTDAACGDGTVNTTAGESCDDGNTSGGDGCSATCVSESCGNSVVEGAEACDTGGDSATCDVDCTPAMCGDGYVNAVASEACDAAGESATCDADCTPATCGDGTLNATAGEACDDGNTASGDGCSPTCASETPDAGPTPDAGTLDAGAADAGRSDAGPADAGRSDAGTADAAMDAGPTSFGVSGGACGCRAAGTGTGKGAAASLALLAALLVVVRGRGARRSRRVR